jgi:hypothetical protein
MKGKVFMQVILPKKETLYELVDSCDCAKKCEAWNHPAIVSVRKNGRMHCIHCQKYFGLFRDLELS